MPRRARLIRALPPAAGALLVLLLFWTFGPAPAGAAGTTGTTPSAKPLWNAYPLNANQPKTKRSPFAPSTPRRQGGSSNRTNVGEVALIAGGLAGVVVVAVGALALYRRSRRDGAVAAPARSRVRPAPNQTVPDSLPARSGEPGPHRALLHPRGREVAADLLDTLHLHGAGKASPPAPARDEDLVLALCKQARSATLAGDIEWRRAPADVFVWERAGGSLAIRRLNGDGRPAYELVVYDWNGAKLDAVQLPPLIGADPSTVTELVGTLYTAARESASRIYEPIDTLIEALRGAARRS
ncbi:MAG TPA: hypothetical protein VE736_04615 [Gaiellaceae bacterium]|nr:hypothetical protein [Gaiellaceae bacterium]